MWKKSLIFGLIELTITGLVGVMLYIYTTKQQLAEFVWALGLLFALHRLLHFAEISDLFDSSKQHTIAALQSANSKMEEYLSPIAQSVNFGQQTNIEKLNAAHKIYSKIDENEFLPVKNAILRDATSGITQAYLAIDKAYSELDKLYRTKKTGKLTEELFYDWIYRTFDDVNKGGAIKAVSICADLEWDDSPQEKRFLESNISAAKRGVSVERLFVLEKDKYSIAKTNPAISSQGQGNEYGIVGKFVNKSHLLKTNPTLLEKAGYGFIIVNGKVVLIDAFDAKGEARGYVSLKTEDIKDYEAIYNGLRNSSEDIDVS